MSTQEKGVSYQASNTYTTLNDYGPKTKNVWLVCHGIGYLSRYFIRHFRGLDAKENYIIAPQAPSKYYLSQEYTHIGASWLTRENKEAEIENVLNYLDAVFRAEQLEQAPRLILLGYSQGVSVITRWAAQRKISFHKLVLYSGRIPAELQAKDFGLSQDAEVLQVYGTADPYLKEETLQQEGKRARELFGDRLKVLPFEGGHEVKASVIEQLLT